MASKRSSAGAIVIAVAVMVVLFFGSFMVGQYPIDPVGVVEIIGAQLFGFDCSQSDMAQTIAVSYTHLDVYKRQGGDHRTPQGA